MINVFAHIDKCFSQALSKIARIYDVFTLTTSSLPDESWCSNLPRNVRWDKGRVECPRCESYNIKKRMVSTVPIKNTFVSVKKVVQ
ncbi:MAG: hypothetical protein L0H53_14290 [Candidatus Nitrosocosmicus sp.]|nr:hypothetical protein [Candidatus Nitrosocosmicus sp.]MDN5868581.1 hypothetical protein [Candidatus Nitrosocosmicus sp.]